MNINNNCGLRVLHVYRTYFPDSRGGIGEIIRQICLNTQSSTFENRVFSLSVNPVPALLKREESELYRYHQTLEVASCGISLTSFSGYKELVNWADIVHYHFPWPFADLLHLATRVKKPSVVTYHSDIVRQKLLFQIYRPLMRNFLNNVDIIVPTSKNYFISSRELCRYSEKTKIIPLGLDDSSYPQLTEDEIDSYRLMHGEGFFLFVGVLRYYKGLNFLLDALKGSSIQCIIAGSGPIESELKEKVKNLGINNVRFLGAVSDSEKVALIKLCRAVVFPSHLRSEAFGVTLIEGAMYGKPLISTEIGTGTSYININGETGYVVPPADSDSLREAMLKLNNDQQLSERMGKAARLRYETEFTGQLMGERYEKLYRELSEKSGYGRRN